MFLLACIGDSCLKASIFLFAVPNIIVCTLEHSCLQVWTVARWRFRFHGERYEGENGALRMVFLGLVRSGIFDKDMGWGTGKKGGRGYGFEDWVPKIDDFQGYCLVGHMVVENQTECLPSFTRLVGQCWNLWAPGAPLPKRPQVRARQ